MNNNIAVVILAGGGGKRLGGVIKANLKIEGTSLLERVIKNVGNAGGVRILSTGNMDPGLFRPGPEWIMCNDLNNMTMGPLAGIAAAVACLQRRNSDAQYLFSVAVDSPFFPGSFAQRALEKINGEHGSHGKKNDVKDGANIHDAVVASYGSQLYPTNALWRIKSISHLPHELEDTSRFGIKGLLKRINAIELPLDGHGGQNPCQNLNHVAYIAVMSDRARTTEQHFGQKDGN